MEWRDINSVVADCPIKSAQLGEEVTCSRPIATRHGIESVEGGASVESPLVTADCPNGISASRKVQHTRITI